VHVGFAVSYVDGVLVVSRLLLVSGDEVEWVQCDVCQCWFHFRCIGLSSISEHEEYVCSRCKKCSAGCDEPPDVSAKVTENRSVAVRCPIGVLSESESDESTDEEEEEEDGYEDDDPIRDFYANESIDKYIIRSKNNSFVNLTAAKTGESDNAVLPE
jgi:hypothetical protein